MADKELPKSGFHGTKHNILPLIKDNKLTSSKERGKIPRYNMSEGDKTYFTPDEGHAWSYANDELTLNNFKEQPRPVVFPVKVSEGSNVTEDRNTPFFGSLSLTSDGPLDVPSEPEWSPPPQKYQGTVTQTALPHINWHQFDMPNWVVYRGDGPVLKGYNGAKDKHMPLMIHRARPLFSSIDAIMKEAHTELDNRKDRQAIKSREKKLAADKLPPVTEPIKEDPDQLKLF
jgi:hypothetical protein